MLLMELLMRRLDILCYEFKTTLKPREQNHVGKMSKESNSCLASAVGLSENNEVECEKANGSLHDVMQLATRHVTSVSCALDTGALDALSLSNQRCRRGGTRSGRKYE